MKTEMLPDMPERELEGGIDGAVGGAAEGNRFMENGAVTHGEGEIKPVMLENDSLGGLEETTLKTAPERPGAVSAGASRGDGDNNVDFANAGMDDIESSSGEAGSKKQGMTEAEARAMLVEDNARVRRESKKANAKGRKTLVVVIILAAVLVVAGIAASAILGGAKVENDAENDNKQEGNNGDNSIVVENAEEDGRNEETEVVELSLEDEVVQRVYGNFQGIARFFDGWWGFYTNEGVQHGDVLRKGMLLLAEANFQAGSCAGDYEDVGGWKVDECISGEKMRQKVKEMFGQELEFTADDVLGTFCGGKQYDIANDEFYQAGTGCGGATSSRLIRVLKAAERNDDEVYLYEQVLLFDGIAYYHIGEVDKKVWDEWNVYWGPSDDIFGEKIGEYEAPDYNTFQSSEDYKTWLEENRNNLTREYGDQFKWTFRKNEAGNYVFAGLERVAN